MVGTMFGARKYQYRFNGIIFQNINKQFFLVVFTHKINYLIHFINGR